MHVAGSLQTCAGLKSSIEAAIHSVQKSFQDKNSDRCCQLMQKVHPIKVVSILLSVAKLCWDYFILRTISTFVHISRWVHSQVVNVCACYATGCWFGSHQAFAWLEEMTLFMRALFMYFSKVSSLAFVFRAGLHNIPATAFLVARESFLGCRKCCKSLTLDNYLSFQNFYHTTTK